MAKKKADRRARSSSKTPLKTPSRPGNNGGRLLTGNPGNGGGPGRPPSQIREQLRGSFEQRIRVLETIADSAVGDDADRMRAIDMMAKYGLGTENEVRLVGFTGAQIAFDHIRKCIRSRLEPELAESVLQDIREALRTI
jgi:hypothetical protein